MNENILRVAVVACLIWSGLLTYFLLNPQGPELSEELKQGKSPVIAYVHGDSIQSNYQFIADREKQLFVAVQQAQIEMERLAGPLQSEAQELIAYANGPDATQDEMGMVQNRLMEIEQELGRIQNVSQEKLIALESNLQNEIVEKIAAEVEEFASEVGLDVVMNWGLSGEGILYGAEAFDVTSSLLSFLNERYTPAEDQPEK